MSVLRAEHKLHDITARDIKNIGKLNNGQGTKMGIFILNDLKTKLFRFLTDLDKSLFQVYK